MLGGERAGLAPTKLAHECRWAKGSVPNAIREKVECRFSGIGRDVSTGCLLPDFDFHSRLSACAMHNISSNLSGRRSVCLLHYSQRAVAGGGH